jgi:hypothetical protein
MRQQERFRRSNSSGFIILVVIFVNLFNAATKTMVTIFEL